MKKIKSSIILLFIVFFNQLTVFSQSSGLISCRSDGLTKWMDKYENITCKSDDNQESYINNTGMFSCYHANKWSSKGIYFPARPEDEIIEYRTGDSKTFRNHDGTNTSFFLSGLHYMDNSGKWQDVDLSLYKNNTAKYEKYGLCNYTNDFKTFVDVNSLTNGIVVEKDNSSVNFMRNRLVSLIDIRGIKTALQSQKEISGLVADRKTVKFSGIYDNIDEQIVMLKRGIEHGYFINSGTIAKDIPGGEIEFSEEIILPDGWYIEENGETATGNFTANEFSLRSQDRIHGIKYCPVVTYDGSVSYDEIMKRVEIPVIGGEIFARSSSLESKYFVTVNGQRLTITYSVPEKWLSDKSRQYPVYVDPQVEIFSAVATNSFTLGGLPYVTSYDDQRIDFLILASDLTAAGLTAYSTISTMGMRCGTTATGMALSNFEIRTQPTTISSFSSFVTTGWTVNYGPTTQTAPVASTWYDYTFTTNAMFDGTSNMLWNVSRDNTSHSGSGSNYCRAIGSGRSAFYDGNSTVAWPYDNGNFTGVGVAPQMRVTYTPCVAPSPPTNVTATPSGISCGSSSSLNATSAGNTINWYTTSSGGTSLGSSPSGSDFNVTPSVTTTYYAEAFSTCPSSSRVPVTVTVTPQTPSSPTNLTATPPSVCTGITVALTALTMQGLVQWWTASTGGSMLGSVISGGQFAINPTITSTYYAKTYSVCGTSPASSITVTVTSLPVPTSPSASPSSIICSSTSTLVATSSYTITWFTSPTGGTPIGTSASLSAFAVSPTATITYYAESDQYASGSLTYNYTGYVRTFLVPVGVSSISIDASGAQGGTSTYGTGGMGGRVQANLSVQAGNLLYIYVGGQGSISAGINGWNGGGSGSNYAPIYGGSGGGASDIRIGSTALSSRIIVGGGGGGGSAYNAYAGNNGGNGGYPSGTNGLDNLLYNDTTCGGGGQANAGGLASTWNSSGTAATAGSFGNGGNAGTYFGGGGGGGGYFGGGGGGPSGGGGGGSSYYTSSGTSNSICTTGYKAGNGQINISWSPITCSSSTRASVTVIVSGLLPATFVTASPSTIFCGDSTNLSAVSTGNLIGWWTAMTGGTLIGSSASGANYNIYPSASTTYYAQAYNNNPCVSTSRVSISITIIPILPPTNVTASPQSVCAGAPSYLSGVSAGNIIKWWTASSGGTLVGSSMSGANFTVHPSTVTTYYAEAYMAGTGSQTFNYVTSSIVTWTVPGGVNSITIDARGASGGFYSTTGGRGARMVGDFAVSPGTILSILVGQCPGSTSYYAGGGGGTFVALGSSYSTATPLIVAGGGGGGYSSSVGIDAPTTQAGTFTAGGNYLGANGYGANAAPCVGGGGGFYSSGAADTYYTFPGGGGFRQGGAGACAASGMTNYQCGGFGGGTAADYDGSCNTMGGNGGGYSGGSGYTTSSKYYGEAGGSFNGGTNQHNYSGASGNTGNGQVIISWVATSCTSALRTSVVVSISQVFNPSNVTASPDTFSCGTSIGLSASVTGFTVSWWDSPTGGTFLGTSSTGTSLAIVPTISTSYYAESNTFVPGSISFNYTGGVQSFVIPNGVNSISVDAVGASGGTSGSSYGNGGNGGRVQTNLAVVPGSIIKMYIGGQGSSSTGGWNGGAIGGTFGGGGGGGATDIRIGGSGFSNRVVVSGGGGGAGYFLSNDNGGDGGGTTGGDGTYSGSFDASYCGSGGTQTSGGVAATYTGYIADTGSLGLGGAQTSYYGGGGGGGYYGGGGGSYYGGGGGGSSWVSPSLCSDTVHTQGYQVGDGQISLSWLSIACSSPGRVSVRVTVNPLPDPQNVASLPKSMSCGSSTNLTATTSGGIVKWWDSLTGGNLLGTSLSGTYFTVSPTMNTVYYAQAYQNPCSSTLRIADSVMIFPLPNPQNVIALPQNLTCGVSANLSATTTGGLIRWWSAPTGGTLLGSSFSGAFFTVFPSASVVYYAEAYQTPCSSILRIADSVIVSPMSAPSPVSASTDTVYCGGSTILTGISAGNSIRWFNVPSGGTMLGSVLSGNGFTVFPSAAMTYYAEAFNQCSSLSRTSVTIYVVPLLAPSVTIDSISMCAGATVGISAISSGNMIRWWDSPIGGTMLGTPMSGVNLNVSPSVTTTYYAEAYNAGSGSHTFLYTTSIIQTFTIPPGVSSIDIDARGASGGYNGTGTGGRGARMTGTFSVSPGAVLSFLVGQCPGSTNLWPGGGGGTFVALGSVYSTATPMIVAGGGGGGYSGYAGIDAPTTQAGTFSTGGNYLGANGYGAITAPCVGGGGGFYSSGAPDSYYSFYGGGGFQQGGSGGCPTSTYSGSAQCGGFGGGTAGDYVGSCNTFGGSGGGYSGGSGYTTTLKYYGEAGGSYNSGANQQNYTGGSGNTGNGQLTISWTATSCSSPQRTPVVVTVTSPSSPSSINATPSTIACGNSSNLSGNSAGFTLSWWDSSTGGNYLGSSSGGLFTVSPTSTTTYYAEEGSYISNTMTFTYLSSNYQSWTVPAGISQVDIDARGASGFSTSSGGTAGNGARVKATLAVSAGQVFFINVGQKGASSNSASGGFNGGGTGSYANYFGGGGGGASDIRIGGSSMSYRVLVAGGGGGAGYSTTYGHCDGGGGGIIGSNGLTNQAYDPQYCGAGGSQTGGGIAASFYNTAGTAATAGVMGNGGSAASYDGGGGGGGGYFGGGGGSSNGGGGGGSSWVRPAGSSNIVFVPNFQVNNGRVSVSWISAICVGPARVPVTVNVGVPSPPVLSAIPASICPSSSGNLTGTTNVGYVNWWNASTGGTLLGSSLSGNNFIISPTTTTTYYAETASACGTSARDSISVNVANPVLPANVTVSQSPVTCGIGTNLSGVFNGGIIRWWTSPTGGVMIGTSGSGMPFAVNPASTTTYYAQSFSTCPGSGMVSVTVIVVPAPAPSGVTSIPSTITCGGTANLAGISTGYTIRWWSALSGGTMIGTSASGVAFSIYPTSTTTYYAESYQNPCASVSRTSITVAVNAIFLPFPVSAIPSAICGNGTSTLSAVSPGNSINWWTASSGGVLLASTTSGGAYFVNFTGSTGNFTYYAEASAVNSGVVTFSYTGSAQSWTVPPSVLNIIVDARGAQGGTYSVSYGNGGLGGRVVTTMPVSTNELLNIFVGGQGTTTTGGWNGGGTGGTYSGGGGGATDIRINGTAKSNRVIVAAGGGGAGYSTNCNGGAGGGLTGGNGVYSLVYNTIYCGAGGTQTSGGVAGTYTGYPATPGTLGSGGNQTSYYGGGGGGGYFGGGAGSMYGGGGGGSSWVNSSLTSNTTDTSGVQGGDGMMIISWNSIPCLSPRVSVTIMVASSNSTAASSGIANPSSLCTGDTSSLSFSGGVLANGAIWYWYLAACGTGSPVGTGIQISVSPTVNSNYYIRAESACNTTACVSASITISTFSQPANSISETNDTICTGSSLSLLLSGGYLGNNGVWNWYSGTCGGAQVGTGNGIVVSPVVSSGYFVRAESYCNTTTCVSVSVFVTTSSSIPDSVSASPSIICSGSNTTLSLSGGTLGNDAIYRWYSGTCGGTTIGSGLSILQSPVSTIAYFVRAEGFCNTTTCKSVNVSGAVNSLAPVYASGSPMNVCSGSNALLSFNGGSLGTNGSWFWYNGTCGGSLLGSGSTIHDYPTTTTTYFVRAEGLCNTTICVSATVSVGYNSTPAATVSSSTSLLCSASSVTLNETGGVLGSGANWYWYGGTCGGNSIGTDTSVIINPAVTSTFYVRAEGQCNTTICHSITVTVLSNSSSADSISVNPSVLCPGAQTNLNINGGNLGLGANWYWYKGSCGGTRVATGISLLDNPSVNTTYYLRAESVCNTTSCVSAEVILNSNSVSANFVSASASSSCYGSPDTLSFSGGILGTGANWYWYAGSCNGIYLQSGTSIIASPTTSTTYYIKASGTCNTTSCVSTIINVMALPVAPVSLSSDRNNFCSGFAGNITLSLSGGSGSSSNWYTGGCESVFVGSGKVLSILSPAISTTYYVNWQTTSCGNSTCLSELITVIPVPVGGSSAITTPDTISSGQSTVLSVTGTLLQGEQWAWYENSCGTGTLIGNGDSVTVFSQVTTTYFVRSENAQCYSSCLTADLVVPGSLNNAGLVSASPNTICVGQSSTLSLSYTLNGGEWYWYTNSCGDNFVDTGSTITVNPIVSTLFFVRQEMGTTYSSCSNVLLIVNTYTFAPDSVTANPPLLGAGNSVTLNINGGSLGTGSDWKWYTASCAGNLEANGDPAILSPVTTTTYYVRGEGICNTTSCETITVIVGYGISGYFTYDNPSANPPNTPLDSVWVFLMDNGLKIDSTQADINGFYSFSAILDGVYNISATTHKPWGGVNASDAVKVKRHFAGNELFTSSLRLHAADVNMSFNINSTDAVKITRRFVGSDTIFTEPDWLFEKPYGGDTINVSVYMNDTVIVNESDVQQNFKGICSGDVNGSNIPPPGAKSGSGIRLDYDSDISAKAGDYVELPISIKNNVESGAISLILKFPGKLAEILDVKLIVDNKEQDLYYNVISMNELRIGWFETSGSIELNTEKPFILIKLKTTDKFKLGDIIAMTLENNPLNEIADDSGTRIENVAMTSSKIEYYNNDNALTGNNDLVDNLQIFPNPAKESLNIRCYLVKDGNISLGIYNILGEKVFDISNKYQLKGLYFSEISLESIPSGIYSIRMISGDHSIIVKKLIISK